MARHFLTQRYSPSDMQEMSALLEGEIRAAGFTIMWTPPHEAQFTSDEAKLAARLADRKTGDVTEPRVEHDVDCVAGVLTLRRGHRSDRVENAGVVFATAAPLVIRNTRLWWEEDEGESSVPPIVHIRALANLAWLKRPKANPDFQLRDLVALCTAAMRPTTRTWNRFLAHLEDLYRSKRLSADQITAVIVSSLSDRLLRDAELEGGDPGDVDAGTLDEVVERVVSQYSAIADQRVHDAEITARNAVEDLRRRELERDGTARRLASRIATGSYWTLIAVLVLASGALIVRNTFDGGLLGLIAGIAVLIVTLVEAVGILGQLRAARTWLEVGLHRRFRSILWGGDKSQGTEVT